MDFVYTYATLLHLPPLRFLCVRGCWDWTQDCCDCDIGSRALSPLSYMSSTTRLDLIYNARLDLVHARQDLSMKFCVFYTNIKYLKKKNLLPFLTLKPNANETTQKIKNIFYKCVSEFNLAFCQKSLNGCILMCIIFALWRRQSGCCTAMYRYVLCKFFLVVKLIRFCHQSACDWSIWNGSFCDVIFFYDGRDISLVRYKLKNAYCLTVCTKCFLFAWTIFHLE